MGWVVGIGIIGLVFYFVIVFIAVHYMEIFYIVIVILGVWGFHKAMRLQDEKLARQNECLRQMNVLGDDSLTFFESMPAQLQLAEDYLNQAEINFSDGAFAPFWDSIEKAVIELGNFDETTQSIEKAVSKYAVLITQYKSVPPQFPLDIKSFEKLNVDASTAERMQTIVRIAQSDFQFATIYEQRRTNQILVAGFTNLGQVLEQMTLRITSSINNLSISLNEVNWTLGNISRSLDKIQHRRKPNI